MKLKTLFALICSIGSANAAIYTVSNVVTGNGSSDALFQNADDSLNSGGIVSVGYFTVGYTISTTDMSANISNFTAGASALVGSSSTSLGGSYAGYVEAAAVDGVNITDTDPLIGESMYVFFGNAATLAGSTSWAIKAIKTISADSPTEETYIANPFGGTAPVFGSIGTYTGDASGFGSSTFQTLKLAAIPEPSALLLTGLGTLLLLRRRRVG